MAIGVLLREIVLARTLQQVAGAVARLAAMDAPGRRTLAALAAEVPAALDQVAHAQIDAEAAAELSGAARIPAQHALLDQHRRLQFDALERAVAHVALADRDRARFAILMRPSAPAAAFEALHDTALAGLRIDPEEHHRAAEQPVMARRHAIFDGRRERGDDGVHHRRHDEAPP